MSKDEFVRYTTSEHSMLVEIRDLEAEISQLKADNEKLKKLLGGCRRVGEENEEKFREYRKDIQEHKDKYQKLRDGLRATNEGYIDKIIKIEAERDGLRCCGNCERYHCDTYSHRCTIAIGGNTARARKPYFYCDNWQPKEQGE
jgi:chromosome segregation ATPase